VNAHVIDSKTSCILRIAVKMGFFQSDKTKEEVKKQQCPEPTNRYIVDRDVAKATFEIVNAIANKLDIDLTKFKEKWEHSERHQLTESMKALDPNFDYDKFLRDGRKYGGKQY
jgi:hypothetical protein